LNSRSIKFRLVAWYAALLTGIVLLLCTLLYLDLRNYLEKGLRETEARRARQLANVLLARVKQNGEAYVVSQVRDWYAPESNDRFIRVTRAERRHVRSGGGAHFPPRARHGNRPQCEIIGREHPADRQFEF